MKIIKKIQILCFAMLLLLLCSAGVAAQETPTTETELKTGSLLLEPSFQEVKTNEEFRVSLLISSEEPLLGADAVLKFDPDLLEVVRIEEGDTFPSLPLKKADKEFIRITGVAEVDKSFKGEGVFANITFKAKDAGSAKITVEFRDGATDESNLTAVQVKDVLGKVESGTYEIGTPLQKGLAGFRRFLGAILPFIIFLIILAILGFFAYRWYKRSQAEPKDIFIPEHAPLDRPPEDNPPSDQGGNPPVT
jgi:hypothetical protein